MNTLNKLLDNARDVCERKSDSALSEAVGVSRQTVMQWRKSERRITDEHLAKLIALAHADPALAVLVREEGAETKAEKALWGPLWDRLSPAISTVAGALLFAVLAAPSELAMHIMSKVTRWGRRLREAIQPAWSVDYAT